MKSTTDQFFNMNWICNIIVSVTIFLCACVLSSQAQERDEPMDKRNSVVFRGFFIPSKSPFYYVNPSFRHKFKIISVEGGLFYGSNISSSNATYYPGVSVGYVIKPFIRANRFEPFFDNRLLLLAGYEKNRPPNWRGGGIFEIGTGIDYRIKQFKIGAGFGMGVGYFHSKIGDFVDRISVWMFPNLSVSYSFK